jgi:V8-like Glu-specific endopeptidase
MNTRTALIGKILRWAALGTILASLFGMPNAVPAHAQTEDPDPNVPVQLSLLEQGGVDHQTLLEGMPADTMNMSVIPGDTRTRITPTNTIPWQYIAQILFVYPDETTEICTGFFIGPFTIITAGHCVYDPGRGGAVTRADVTPGLDGTTSPYGMTQGILTYTTSGWYLSQNPLYDYGAVQLPSDATISDDTGWMPYGYFSDSYMSNYLSGTNNMAGYPLDRNADCPVANSCLWWDSGPLTGITLQLLSYGMDTDLGDAGEDGAPIWINDGGNLYATGINLFDSNGLVFPTGCAPGSNCGLRITSEVATNFTTWSGQGPVTDCFTLTLTHTGEGIDPSALPDRSPGCALSQYLPGTPISLTASPAAHWKMDSWVGTDDDSSTALTNAVLMPASNRTVTANYNLICWAFSASVSPGGTGSLYFDPPSNCPGGYGEGTIVMVVALANPGYAPKNWTGSVTSSDNPVFISVDAAKSITVNFVPALSGGTYDDQNPAFTYAPTTSTYPPIAASGWTNYPSGRTSSYNKTLHLSRTIGDSAEVSIYGTGFTLYYSRASNRGKMNVFLDDNITPFATINMYSTSAASKRTWKSPAIPAGVHTLRFVHATGTYVDIDGLIVVPVPDIIPPATISDLGAATGANGGSVVLNWTAPGDDITSGKVSKYLVRYSTAPITSDTAWNAATAATIGLPVPTASGSPQTMTASGLTPGATFYFAVRAQDEVSNLGGLSNSPSATAKYIAPLSMGIHDDNDPNIAYSGAWNYRPSSTGPYLKTLHISAAIGDSAMFSFNGASFTLTYTRAPNRGKMEIYIDGNKVTTLNLYGSSTAWQKKWTSATLPPATHVVRLVHLSGAYMDVDAITIPDGVPPAAILNLSGASGTAPGSVNLTWDAVGDDGITGTATSYLVRYSNTPITTEILWNAGTPVTVGVPTPHAFGTPETMTVNGLYPGSTYYFLVRAKDDAGNLGGLSNSPAAQSTPVTPLAAGMYDDSDPNIVYMGGPWSYSTSTGPYNNTQHMVTATSAVAAANNQAVFMFTGRSFTLYYTKSTNRGRVDIYIDGNKVTTLNMYGSTTAWQKTWISPVYASGTHTVKIVQVFVSTTLKYVSVDAILVNP